MTGHDTAPAATSLPALLRARRFWPVFAVQFLNAFNDQLFKTAFVALLTWKLAAEQGLEGQIDLLNQVAAGLFILPFALFSPMAGALADGRDMARMMRVVILTEFLLMLAAAIAFHLGSLPLLLGLLALSGVQSAFFAPIKYAVLPRYLAREEIVAGNALVQAGTFIAILAGQIAGAKLVLMEGGVTIAAAATLLASGGGYAASLFARPLVPAGPRRPADWLLVPTLVAGLRSAARAPDSLRAMIAFAWFWFVGATVLAFLPPLARETLHGTEDVALILLVTFSFGVGTGALIANRVMRGRVSYAPAPWGALGMLAGILLAAAGATGFGADLAAGAPLLSGAAFLARPDAWPVVAGFALMSVAGGVYAVPVNVIYQVTSPEAERARFVAASNVISAIAMVLSAVVSVLLLALGLDRVGAMVAAGLTALPVALLVLRCHRRLPAIAPGRA